MVSTSGQPRSHALLRSATAAGEIAVEEYGYGLGPPDGILVLRYPPRFTVPDFPEERDDFLHQIFWSPDGVLTLDMPWYAVDTTTAITVTATTDCPADPGLVPGTVYEYEPDGLQFGSLPTLSVKYDPANLPARTPETSLRIAEVVAGAWSPLPSTVDTDTHTVSAEINGFCVIGVVGQPTDPRFVSKWTVVDGVPLDAPSGICVDSGGQVYVADTGNDSVVVTTPAGVVVTRYPAETFYSLYPTAVAVYGAAKTVCILDKANGRVVRCTQAGLRIDDLHPAYALGQASKAMALDGSGFCYVPVIETNSIHVRSWEGEGPFTFGSEGYGDGQFHFSNAIVGIAVKADGTIYVSESNRLAESGRIQMFTHGGAFIARWEEPDGFRAAVERWFTDATVWENVCAASASLRLRTTSTPSSPKVPSTLRKKATRFTRGSTRVPLKLGAPSDSKRTLNGLQP